MERRGFLGTLFAALLFPLIKVREGNSACGRPSKDLQLHASKCKSRPEKAFVGPPDECGWLIIIIY